MKEPKPNLENFVKPMLGVLHILAAVIGAILEAYGKWRELWGVFGALQPVLRWSIFVVLLVAGILLWLLHVRSRRSLLLRPDAFNLQADNPHHLKGRSEDITNLHNVCIDARLVWLVGESGSGKTALIRSGLVAELKKTGRLYPIYLDAWGQDWEDGPYDSLAGVVQHTLCIDDRKALKLDGPVTRDKLFRILASFRDHIGRTPLLIFDQFDDYQAIHRDKFLKRDRHRSWISVTYLCKRNAFWKQVEEQVVAGKIHLLFVVRADSSAGLLSVQFCEPMSVPLDPIGSQYLLPVLDELTSTAPDTPAIVVNPDGGWSQLKRRLERDLIHDGFVLPIYIQSAVKGLASLPGHILTTSNYERVGGLAGLGATFVERCINSAQRHYGLDPKEARTLLLALVDGSRTIPRPASELAAKANISLEMLKGVFTHWEERFSLVRRRTSSSVSVPGSRPSGAVSVSNDDLWALYHDYLTRGVLAAETRANRWIYFLRDSRRAFNEAAGNFRASWRALLSPGHQLQLFWHRLRGHFRYGDYAPFARLSVVRFAPFVLCGVLAAVALSFVAGEQIRQDNRYQARELLHDVNPGMLYLNQAVLWRVAAAPDGVRRAFWEEVFKNDHHVRYYLNNPFLRNRLVHATIGLDPDLHERRHLVENVLIPVLSREQLQEHVFVFAVELCASIRAGDLELSEPISKQLLYSFLGLDSLLVKGRIARLLATAPCNLTPEHAQRILADLRSSLAVVSEPEALSHLAQAMVAISSKLNPEQAQVVVNDLFDIIEKENDIDVKSGLAQAIAVGPAKISPEQRRVVSDVLLSSLLRSDKLEKMSIIAKAMAAGPTVLSPEQARVAFYKLLLTLKRAEAHGLYVRDISEAMVAVVGVLGGEQSQSVFFDLISSLDEVNRDHERNDILRQVGIARAMVVVADKISPEQAQARFADLRSLLTASRSLQRYLIGAVVAVAEKKAHRQPRSALAELCRLLRDVNEDDARDILGRSMVGVAGRVTPEQAELTINDLLFLLNSLGNDSFDTHQYLAESIAVVARKLTPEQAQSSIVALRVALLESSLGVVDFYLARAMLSAAGNLSPLQERSVVYDLFLLLKGLEVSERRVRIAQALAEMPRKLTSTQVEAVSAELLANLSKTQDPNGKLRIVHALVSMAGESATPWAQDVYGELLSSLMAADRVGHMEKFAQALVAVPGRLSPSQQREMVRILKWPVCVGVMQSAILKKLEEVAGENFHGDLSRAAQWAIGMGYGDVIMEPVSPPKATFIL